DRVGQTKFAKRRLEDDSRWSLLCLAKRLAAQQVARVPVGDGERVTQLSAADWKVPFEVGAPDGVRSVVAEKRLAVRRARPLPRSSRPDQSMASEDLSDRARRRKLQPWVRGGQRREQLFRPPEGVPLPRLDDDAHHLFADCPRTRVWLVRA